ncbi:dTMP kinase [Microlunatus sp. GCM10028923]|uniref:dTMP kinase n=1 Tax=Microlunatus sp. GCM10028923 TaxID=3273400 RepID=UPI00361C88E6
MTGLFIVFEGGDGVGKSTQARRLAAWLGRQGHEVVRTFEPGDTPAGREIRRLVLDHASGELDPRAEALLYAADKAQHLYELVRPALRRDAVVVCDRYIDSMLAYQGAGRVLDLAEVSRIARWATDDLRPDLTVLLDLDPRQAVSGKAVKDKLESAGESFHDRARQHFLDLAAERPADYLVLPARDAEASIAAAVAERVAALLSDRSGTLTS